MTVRILVVEDEESIADAIVYALRSDGYETDAVADGESALEAASATAYDLLLLDLMLPGLSGVEVCRRIRAESSVPILMLTARSSEVDYVVGLDAGADDYVAKPFSMPELLGRIRAILRRRALDRAEDGKGVRKVGELELDLSSLRVRVEDRSVQLTPSEFRLLALLTERPGHAFSRRELMQHLWDSSYVGDERAADVHVANLRQKIEQNPADPVRLLTVRGTGYMLAQV
jgi:two-component system response regulator RegX3